MTTPAYAQKTTLLREAAALMRKGVPEGAILTVDFIDYPTAWAIQKAGLAHTDERCSAVQTSGAMLCDCDAVQVRWSELRTMLTMADWLDNVASRWAYSERHTPEQAHALNIARAYLCGRA